MKDDTLSQEIHTAINQMSRAKIASILEQEGGYAVYENESIDSLKEVLRSDLTNGIISIEILIQYQ